MEKSATELATIKKANKGRGYPSAPHFRHPELVSGSIVPQRPSFNAGEWTLKQVQGDAGLFQGDTAFV
jgi:hypothetical protein